MNLIFSGGKPLFILHFFGYTALFYGALYCLFNYSRHYGYIVFMIVAPAALRAVAYAARKLVRSAVGPVFKLFAYPVGAVA